MVNYYYETDFNLETEAVISNWILQAITEEGYQLGEIQYIFCDDSYLHNINLKYLQHDTLTDVISFDYTVGKLISGDIYISIPRVRENAIQFNTSFLNELHRVMVHGVLHYCGYKDKTQEEKTIMRSKENYYLNHLKNKV